MLTLFVRKSVYSSFLPYNSSSFLHGKEQKESKGNNTKGDKTLARFVLPLLHFLPFLCGVNHDILVLFLQDLILVNC